MSILILRMIILVFVVSCKPIAVECTNVLKPEILVLPIKVEATPDPHSICEYRLWQCEQRLENAECDCGWSH